MCVDTHITSGTRQRLALTVGNVLLGLGITVLLGHTEVDDMDDVGSLGRGATNEEVVGLYVAVNEVLFVDRLDARKLEKLAGGIIFELAKKTYHLLGHHHHSLGGKPAVAVIEKVLKTGTEEVDDENVVQALLSEVVDIGDTSCGERSANDSDESSKIGRHTTSDQNLVGPVLITQLRGITLPGFLFQSAQNSIPPFIHITYEFNGHLLVVQKVGALEDDTERTLTDLLAYAVVDTYHVRRRGRHR